MSNNSTNIDSGGGSLNITGSAVGGSANTVTISDSLNIGARPERGNILASLNQLRAELDKANDLPSDEADDLKTSLDAAIKAISRPQPNKERAVEKLSIMQKVLEGLKGNVASALALGKLVGEALLAVKSISF